MSYPVRLCRVVINRPGNLKHSRRQSAVGTINSVEEDKESDSVTGTDFVEQGDSNSKW